MTCGAVCEDNETVPHRKKVYGYITSHPPAKQQKNFTLNLGL